MKIALISDIHEDIVNLKRALKFIKSERCDKIICLGDVVGFNESYYPHFKTRNAKACIDLIKEHCQIAIIGNHDLHAIKKIPELTQTFSFPENWYNYSIEERTKMANNKVWLYNDGELDAQLTKPYITWISELPEIQILKTDVGNILLSHFISPNINGVLKQFFIKSMHFAAHKALMHEHKCDYAFAGHMHYQGLFISSKRIKIKAFNKKHKLKMGDCVIIPPIAFNENETSICIFDTKNLKVTAKRI